jgi:hypothetical protein
MRRLLAGLLGVFDLSNGLCMLLWPATWYDAVPGVHGAYNPHFVQDVGAAFVAAGLGLLARAWQPRWWPAAATGAVFLGTHALLHLVEWAQGHAHAPGSDALLVVLPAALAAWASLPGDGPVLVGGLVHAGLRSFARRYDYDTGYMQAMWDESPAAFLKFSLLTPSSFHREAAPVEAYFASKLVGALSEDCGPCTQLVVNMAREAGMAHPQIEAVLRRDLAAMSPETRAGFLFADAVIRKLPEEDDAREAVRALWGTRGVIDLTLGMSVGRVYPMTKAGLGFAKECRLVMVGSNPVAVVHAEA